MNMSRTNAIKMARGFVSKPHRRSVTDYVVYGPYDDSDPHGPSTEYQADSYSKAMAARSKWVARIALSLMGRLNYESEFAVEYRAYDYNATIESLVDAGLQS
jgi:hypothetical protein